MWRLPRCWNERHLIYGMLRKFDIPWLLMLAAIVAASFVLWRGGGGDAGTLQWFVGDTGERQQISLAVDQTVTIHGHLGDSVVEIRDGQVRFTQSPCQHKICIQAGWIDQAGEVLACVPNQVALELLGQQLPDAEALDGMTF